jgi:hypothetical protein
MRSKWPHGQCRHVVIGWSEKQIEDSSEIHLFDWLWFEIPHQPSMSGAKQTYAPNWEVVPSDGKTLKKNHPEIL